MSAKRTSLGDYLHNLYKFDELTKDQEASLAKQIQAGDQAALDLLIKHNLRFVVSVVKEMPQWNNGSMPIEDVLGYANKWLVIAALRWKPTNDARFCTYAKKFILRGVRRDINNHDKIIRLPVNIEEDIRKLNYLERKMSQKLNRDPTDAELADAMGVAEKRIGLIKGHIAREPISLDAMNVEHLTEDRDE